MAREPKTLDFYVKTNLSGETKMYLEYKILKEGIFVTEEIREVTVKNNSHLYIDVKGIMKPAIYDLDILLYNESLVASQSRFELAVYDTLEIQNMPKKVKTGTLFMLKVVDKAGTPVADVNLYIKKPDGSTEILTSDKEGNVNITLFVSGNYTITLKKELYKEKTYTLEAVRETPPPTTTAPPPQESKLKMWHVALTILIVAIMLSILLLYRAKRKEKVEEVFRKVPRI